MNRFLQYIYWWVGVLLLQLFFIFYFRPTLIYTPYIYLLLLFRASNSASRSQMLILAFLSGLLIDAFTNSWGVHAASAVFVLFLLPVFLSLFSQNALGGDAKFSVEAMGDIRYSIMLFMLLFVYHLFVEFLWYFSFYMFINQIFKAFLSSLIAAFIIFLLYQLFRHRKEEENG